VLWNTVYLDCAIAALKPHRQIDRNCGSGA
jgi:hypothetical protein